MDPDIDIRLLRAFVTVADTGTVSAAADKLARTQAAVSMQLQRLENEVGTQLLHRSSRGVTLTEAGEILLAFARRPWRSAKMPAARLPDAGSSAACASASSRTSQ